MRAADDDCELRHWDTGYGRDEFGPVLGDASGLCITADHEPGDVLQEHEWDAALAAEFDEVCSLERGLGEQNSVVSDDSDGITVDSSEATDQSVGVALLELVEVRAVDDS